MMSAPAELDLAPSAADAAMNATRTGTPRLGFVGVGWIGRHRMEAIVRSGAASAVALVDASDDAVAAARELAPAAARAASLDELLEMDLDGIVIATPSALHAGQAIAALERGIAVFCQKPLARTGDETQRVINAARRADRLLGVDLSYRFTDAMQSIRDLIQAGEIGRVYAVDLVFHNAYGPDKPWFYDAALSGGGCVIDLGIHLVDLALWTLDFPSVLGATGRLHANGRLLAPGETAVEDFAEARIDLDGGITTRLACSWKLPAGKAAVIEARFYGTHGGAALRNIDGSFYDFTAELLRGTSTETLTVPPDEWGGRAAVDWARRLADGERFDVSCDHLADVARALDGIYGR